MDLFFLTTLFLGHRINFSCFLNCFYQLRYASLSHTTETLVIFCLLPIKSAYLVLLYL